VTEQAIATRQLIEIEQVIETAVRQVVRDLEAQGNYTCFEYAGVRTGYYNEVPEASVWLQRFFGAYFSTSARLSVNATLYSTGDAVLFAILQMIVERQSSLAKNAYVDISLTDTLALIYKQATKVTPVEDVYYLLFKKERKIVLVTTGNLEVEQEESMQTLRALMKWLLIEKGWLPMHAACAAKHGRVICISGCKAVGKTSTLLNLMAKNGCNLVAIDKFLMHDAGTHVEVCGVPGKCGIRVGSAIGHPQMLNWLAEQSAPFFPHMSLEEVQHIAATNTPEQLSKRKEKISLLASELTDLFATSITPLARLGLFLFPTFDLSIEQSRLLPYDRDLAIKMVLESYASMLSKGEDFLLHFFDLSDEILKKRLAALLSKYLPLVPVYELYQNHKTNDHSARLVAGLVAQWAETIAV
jgi:hypothetical protein